MDENTEQFYITGIENYEEKELILLKIEEEKTKQLKIQLNIEKEKTKQILIQLKVDKKKTNNL